MILTANDDTIRRAAHIIRKGGLVVFPTETVYGLGANAMDARAVQKIFAVKNRPPVNPLIVHIDSIRQLRLVTLVPRKIEDAEWFKTLIGIWPGPLTLVLPRSSSVPTMVTANLDSVAVRMPSHPVARKLLAAAATPIAAPSANFSSQVTATTAQHVAETLGAAVDLILDGGPCEVGVESTILSLLEWPPRILRPGGIAAERLSEILEVPIEELTRKAADAVPLAPGMLKEHYAPNTPLVFRDTASSIDHTSGESASTCSGSAKVGLISFGPSYGKDDRTQYSVVRSLSATDDLSEVARNLFSALYEMDKLGLTLIVVDRCEEEGIGRAIMDRLRRATMRFAGKK